MWGLARLTEQRLPIFLNLRSVRGRTHGEKEKSNKIRALAEKAKKKGDYAKAERIVNNNLGRIKWNHREASFKGRIKTLVFTATIELMHDAIKAVAFEDLTEQFSSKAKRSKRTKRNLNSWCKGAIRSVEMSRNTQG